MPFLAWSPGFDSGVDGLSLVTLASVLTQKVWGHRPRARHTGSQMSLCHRVTDMETSSRVVVGVLAVQGDVVEHVRMLERVGADAVRVRRAADLAGVDALVIPGGESTVMMRLIAQGDLLEPLRERLAAGMPAYGSCAGMILLADRILDGVAGQRTLGGIDVTVRRNAFGRQVASFEADVDVTGVDDGPVRAVFIRAPWVEEIGDGVEVLSRVALPTGGDAVVAVRQGTLLATSFHPEVTDDARMHALFVDMVVASRDAHAG